jgi:hypothetical protein
MDLIDLSEQLNKCFESSRDAHDLYSIAVTWIADAATKDALRTKKDLPLILARVLNGEPLLAIFKSVQLSEPPQDSYRALMRWLNLVLYTLCNYVPNEQNAHNVALAHPISMWLFKECKTVEACCHVCMYLARIVGKHEVPMECIRLPEVTERFKVFILPKMVEYHARSLEELKEIAKEYTELFGSST